MLLNSSIGIGAPDIGLSNTRVEPSVAAFPCAPAAITPILSNTTAVQIALTGAPFWPFSAQSVTAQTDVFVTNTANVMR